MDKNINTTIKSKFSRREFVKNSILAVGSCYFLTPVYLPSRKKSIVDVSVDKSDIIFTSKFNIGVTHVGRKWEDGNPAAVEKAKKLLAEGLTFQNQHLMNWGTENPEPSPGVYNWDSLDKRIQLIRSMNGTPIITLCSAPGWMNTTGEDHPHQVSPNHWADARVKDEYVNDYADLCRETAMRYTDVKYFQIWNEFKGYWNKDMNNWDYIRFTKFYNTVYEAVKSVRPDAQLGGPYYSFDSVPEPKEWEVIDYWFNNKRDAEFTCFDGWIAGYPPTGERSEESDKMKLTGYFGKIADQFRKRTALPIWISEFYGGWSSNPMFTAANHASCYLHSLLNDVSLVLLWGPSSQRWNYLFTSTRNESGGEPSPHYEVVKTFNKYYGPGTKICKSSSSSPDLEVLASPDTTFLINKKDEGLSVSLDGDLLKLRPYECRLIEE